MELAKILKFFLEYGESALGCRIEIEFAINLNDDGTIEKTIEGKVLDDLNLHRYCCRRMFLGNVHLISYI